MNMEVNGMELTKQEAHCIARLLQSAIFSPEHGLFDACSYCKYKCFQEIDNGQGVKMPQFDLLLRKLMNETGVDLIPGAYGAFYPGGFPYKKFLKNSNDEIKEFFRSFFKDI